MSHGILPELLLDLWCLQRWKTASWQSTPSWRFAVRNLVFGCFYEWGKQHVFFLILMTTVFGWYHQICNLDLPFQLSPRSFNIIQFYTLAALSRRVQVFFGGPTQPSPVWLKVGSPYYPGRRNVQLSFVAYLDVTILCSKCQTNDQLLPRKPRTYEIAGPPPPKKKQGFQETPMGFCRFCMTSD